MICFCGELLLNIN